MTSMERLNSKIDVLDATTKIVRAALDDLKTKGSGITEADVDAATARVDADISALQERVQADDPGSAPQPPAPAPVP